MLERIATNMHLNEVSILGVLDILLLALIIYQLLLIIRGTRAVNVLIALTALLLIYVATGRLVELKAVHAVLGNLLLYVPFAIIVLFQNQIRRALAQFGKNPLAHFFQRNVEQSTVDELSLAAVSLASRRIGALICIERSIGLRSYGETGIPLDALISYDLLMNIFTRRSPLHDGAVIIADNRVQAASAYLPLTTNPTLSRTYGTRHRAAIGVTEETDALVIVVSEERGEMSLARNGRIQSVADGRALKRALAKELLPEEDADASSTGRGWLRLWNRARPVAGGGGDA